MATVKIFMCCHKSFDTVPPLCVPVQGGAAVNPPVEGALPDVGKNGDISEKNPAYCELTVMYWAWKNAEADHYGFCHYRRFFCFDRGVKRPYIAVKSLSEKAKARCFGSAEEIAGLIKKYDIAVPRAEDMGVTAREYYYSSEHHYKEDLDLFLEILREKLPGLSGAAERYMSGKRQYFCNMFIMKKEIFYDYCEKLFLLLEEFDSRKKLHGDFQSDRTDGYLGERFLGIYLTSLDNVKTLELARIDAGCPFRKRAVYALLPPESRRRAAVKRLVKKRKDETK